MFVHSTSCSSRTIGSCLTLTLSSNVKEVLKNFLTLLLLTLMMKVLSLLNVNTCNTVLALLLVKKEVKSVKNLP